MSVRLLTVLERARTCTASREYYNDYDGDWRDAWEKCHMPEWMLWIAARMSYPRKEVMRAVAECVRLDSSEFSPLERRNMFADIDTILAAIPNNTFEPTTFNSYVFESFKSRTDTPRVSDILTDFRNMANASYGHGYYYIFAIAAHKLVSEPRMPAGSPLVDAMKRLFCKKIREVIDYDRLLACAETFMANH